MNTITLDLVMNQPSGNIIEIGYSIHNLRSKELLLKKSIVINPNEPIGTIETPEGKTVSMLEYAGISEAEIKAGKTLLEGYNELVHDVKSFNTTTTVIQWGDGDNNYRGDHDYLRQKLGLSWHDFVFKAKTWDAKELFQVYRAFAGKGAHCGLPKALEYVGLEYAGKPHRASNDALNTFRLFAQIGTKVSLADTVESIFKKAA